MTYLDKIIIGNDGGSEQYRLFIMRRDFYGEGPGGYDEKPVSGRDSLIYDLSLLLQGKVLGENRKFEITQIQNGPLNEDLVPGFHYLNCFPAIDESEFESILGELKLK